MFIKPNSPFGQDFTPENNIKRAQEIANEREEALRIQEARTCFDVLNELKPYVVNPTRLKYLQLVEQNCQSLDAFISHESSLKTPPQALKERINLCLTSLSDQIEKINTYSTDIVSKEERGEKSRLTSMLKEINLLANKKMDTFYQQCIQRLLPKTEPAFENYLSLRENKDYNTCLEIALKKIKTEIFDIDRESDGEFCFSKILFCIECRSNYEFEARWIDDLRTHLHKLDIRSETIDNALSSKPPIAYMNDFYACKNLPKLLVVVGTDELEKKRQTPHSFWQEGEVWTAAMIGMQKSKGKIYPLFLSGAGQAFWPAACSDQMMIPSLKEYPIAKRAYHTVLFDMISELYPNEKYKSQHDKIVDEFYKEVNPILTKNKL